MRTWDPRAEEIMKERFGRNRLIALATAVAGEWFEGHGTCENLGYFGSPENRETAEKLGAAFGEWIHDVHVDLSDENTVLLRVKLTDGKLLSDGTKYEI